MRALLLLALCAAAPIVPAAQDNAARMTIPVMVNGAGPFPFVIDTGADRTVISRDLAAALQLPAGHRVRLHDAAGTAPVETALLDRLSVGGRDIRGVEAPLLNQSDLGAAGMLGIDALRDQQVVMDFTAGTFVAGPSRSAAPLPVNTIVVLGKRRFGQLVLVDAEANGVPIFVILDSGAQNSLGNAALQYVVTSAATRKPENDDVISVMGTHVAARTNQIDEIRLGGMVLRGVPIAYAELEIFRQFGLTHRPTMLLGMDVLRLFRSVSVDFLKRQAAFVPQ